jgi:CBS domain-containing protein
MKVQELMSRPVVTCRQDESASAAAGRMWDHDCGALPVVDDKGLVVGMITDRDICMAGYIQGLPLSAISVSTTMAGNVCVCHAGDSVDQVERLMADRQIRRLPVVDSEGRPIGILSINDVARQAVPDGAKVLGGNAVVKTLAAISRRRLLLATPAPQPLGPVMKAPRVVSAA